ncbi:MAG: hypothetical protein CSA39_04875 [Flavobacteriales bacterium]|nr:MAG: hypothetical protein CSA39_04875 [Flavobacteriales bacterium]
MKFLRTNMLVMFLLSACTVSTVKHLKETSTDITSFKNPYFADAEKDYVYKTNITAYSHQFGGLMIIKKMANRHHRIVFTTEMGNKMFDAELNNGNFKINFIVEQLDRKALIHTLEKDFSILLQDNVDVVQSFENEYFRVYKSSLDKRFNYYFTNKTNRQLEKIINTTKTKEKVEISFKSKDGLTADFVLIEHKDIKLKVQLVAI